MLFFSLRTVAGDFRLVAMLVQLRELWLHGRKHASPIWIGSPSEGLFSRRALRRQQAGVAVEPGRPGRATGESRAGSQINAIVAREEDLHRLRQRGSEPGPIRRGVAHAGVIYLHLQAIDRATLADGTAQSGVIDR